MMGPLAETASSENHVPPGVPKGPNEGPGKKKKERKIRQSRTTLKYPSVPKKCNVETL